MSAGVAGLAALSVPVVVTITFRLFDTVPTPVPFLALFLFGVGALTQPKLRALGAGVLFGVVATATLLLFLFVTLGNDLERFG